MSHQTACTDLLYVRSGGVRVFWDTTMHEARIWLRLCYAARTYDPDKGDMPISVHAWYDGAATNVYETFRDMYNTGRYEKKQ